MPIKVQHFKTRSSDNRHDVWCGVCDWSYRAGTGTGASGRAARRARAHVKETGHVVYIDVTRQHGYQPINEVKHE